MRGTVAILTGHEQVGFREFELPEPGPGQVLLRVRRANVCGSDVHVFHGEIPALRNAVLGHEFVGEIVAMGAGVRTDFAGVPVTVGDRVVPVYYLTCRRCSACQRGAFNNCENGLREWMISPEVAPHFRGAFATHYLVTPDQYFYRVPESLSDRAVAGANCGLAQVIFALDRTGLTSGDVIVVQGAGGLGLYATAYARDRGARVIVIDGVPDRLDLAARFGAHNVVDLRAYPDSDQRAARVAELTRGGADIVLEVTGVPAAFAEAMQLVRVGGRVVSIGNLNTGAANEIAFAPGVLTRKNATVQGYLRYDPWYLHHALRFLDAGGRRYPFDRLSEQDFPLHDLQTAIESSARRQIARPSIIVN